MGLFDIFKKKGKPEAKPKEEAKTEAKDTKEKPPKDDKTSIPPQAKTGQGYF